MPINPLLALDCAVRSEQQYATRLDRLAEGVGHGASLESKPNVQSGHAQDPTRSGVTRAQSGRGVRGRCSARRTLRANDPAPALERLALRLLAALGPAHH